MATPPVECKACLTTAHAADVRRIQYPRGAPERQAVREEYILTRRAACSEYLHSVFVCLICCMLARVCQRIVSSFHVTFSAASTRRHPIQIRGSLERNTSIRNSVRW